jgi:hypothetical protein
MRGAVFLVREDRKVECDIAAARGSLSLLLIAWSPTRCLRRALRISASQRRSCATAGRLGLRARMSENGVIQGLADSYAFWVVLFLALVVVYLLPTLVGLIRGVDRMALVFLVNLIGSPSGIGWVAAMIIAFGPRRLPRGPAWPRKGTPVAMWRE